MRYLVGTPACEPVPFAGGRTSLVPIGQADAAGRLLGSIRSRLAMEARLRREYCAVVCALEAAGADLRVLNLDHGDRALVSWLRERGCASLRFLAARNVNRWQMFPRDMFLYCPPARVLLVHSRLFRLRDRERRGAEIVHSRWAEGGRTLTAGNVVLLGRHPEARRAPRGHALDLLRQRGIRVASIPHPLSLRLKRPSGRQAELVYEPHLDRAASLLQRPDGTLVLLLDPGYRSGPLTAPWSAAESLQRVRRACARLEIEVVVPTRVDVPYGASVLQLDGGPVVTGGDEAVAAACAGLVGEPNVHTTEVPVAAYPVYAAAGLHCLVTELPEPLLGGG